MCRGSKPVNSSDPSNSANPIYSYQNVFFDNFPNLRNLDGSPKKSSIPLKYNQNHFEQITKK